MIYLPNTNKKVSKEQIELNEEKVYKNRNEYIEFMIKQFQDYNNASLQLKYEVRYLVYDIHDNNLKAKLEKLNHMESDTKRTVIDKFEINIIIHKLTMKF